MRVTVYIAVWSTTKVMFHSSDVSAPSAVMIRSNRCHDVCSRRCAKVGKRDRYHLTVTSDKEMGGGV